MALFLTFYLTFYLSSILTYFLAYILTYFLASILAIILASILTVYLSFCLAVCNFPLIFEVWPQPSRFPPGSNPDLRLFCGVLRRNYLPLFAPCLHACFGPECISLPWRNCGGRRAQANSQRKFLKFSATAAEERVALPLRNWVEGVTKSWHCFWVTTPYLLDIPMGNMIHKHCGHDCATLHHFCPFCPFCLVWRFLGRFAEKRDTKQKVLNIWECGRSRYKQIYIYIIIANNH